MLIDWRDVCPPPMSKIVVLKSLQEGKEWVNITEEYLKLSGMKIAPCKSTLPNRYQRIKNNFAVVRQEDELLIVEAKKELETKFENELWTNVGGLVKKNGGGSYSVSAHSRLHSSG